MFFSDHSQEFCTYRPIWWHRWIRNNLACLWWLVENCIFWKLLENKGRWPVSRTETVNKGTSERFWEIWRVRYSFSSEQPEKWLQKEASHPLSQLCCVMTIIGNQGLVLQLDKEGSVQLYLILLRDERRTKNVLHFLLSELWLHFLSPNV